MIKNNKHNIIVLLLIFLTITSLVLGFFFNEDLSTGGATWDFKKTWPIIISYSNLNFFNAPELTRHMPLHYLIMSVFNSISGSQNGTKLIYLLFSFLSLFFLYLNISKIYNQKKILIIFFCSTLCLLPLFRASVIWSNAHLTAIIFFLIGNYFYLKSKEKGILFYKALNLLFLSFSIYSVQTYLIIFLFYLYRYFISEKFIEFFKLFLFSGLFSLPGVFFIFLNPRITELASLFTRDFYFTVSTNFSIIFFFLSFLIINNENFKILLDKVKSLKWIEVLIISIIFFFMIYNSNFFIFGHVHRGGGFFYKLSYFILNNNYIFILSAFFGLIMSYIITKIEPKFLYILLIMNLMCSSFVIYQKYFEPLFLILTITLFKNFLINNILLNLKNISIFYILIFLYFIIAYINYLNNFSYKLVG